MSCHKQDAINELIPSIKAEGFRVFIAGSGTYGFYTDNEGTKLISFQCDLGGISFSGNYVSPGNGSGWRIMEGSPHETTFQKIFDTHPPFWAVGDTTWRFSTLAEQLERYNRSSHFKEVKS